MQRVLSRACRGGDGGKSRSNRSSPGEEHVGQLKPVEAERERERMKSGKVMLSYHQSHRRERDGPLLGTCSLSPSLPHLFFLLSSSPPRCSHTVITAGVILFYLSIGCPEILSTKGKIITPFSKGLQIKSRPPQQQLLVLRLLELVLQ